jgi:REP element-mobilizing transposase RayT
MAVGYYKNKYRIDSIRLACCDYSQAGYYFITICTKNKINYFGKISCNKMILSKLGYVAKNFLKKIPEHYPNTKIDSFIIMPNHIHLIINVMKYRGNDKSSGVEARNSGIIKNNMNPAVEARNCASLRKYDYKNKFGVVQSKNISAMIRAYKSTEKKFSNQNNMEFNLQERFYDYIVRDDSALNNIRQYIRINPPKWHFKRNY